MDQNVAENYFRSVCGAIQRVGIVGGTHGNELSGVTLVRRWLHDPSSVTRASFRTTVEQGNPRAIQRCVRYTDLDLNRCYTQKSLREDIPPGDNPYEIHRAKELNGKFGPKGSSDAYDVIIDLHNTTSNMGICFIPTQANDLFVLHAAHYVSTKSQRAIQVLTPSGVKKWRESPSLCSLGKHGMSENYVHFRNQIRKAFPFTEEIYPEYFKQIARGMEIGPQTHGTLPYEKLEEMNKMVQLVLDFIELYNNGHEFEGGSIETYNAVDLIEFPLSSSGFPRATIHPQLQSRDWRALNPGDAMFMSFDGETITEETVYPAFIAEAAYFEQNIAFWKTRKAVIEIPPLRKD